MMDWIWKSLKELDISSAEINLFTELSEPTQFISNPIKVYFKELRTLIERRLVEKGFEKEYITEGIFKIDVSQFDRAFGKVSIQCILTTRENRTLAGKVYSESTYPIAEFIF